MLGITLYTAWPTITFWLNRSELAGWTIRVTAVTGVAQGDSNVLPDACPHESHTNLDSVLELSASTRIQSRRISVEPYSYDFMPALHGFRLGNGDLFYSILPWQADGRIGRSKYSYEFVPHRDESASAQAIREIFDSWFVRACRTPWQR